MEQAMGVLKNAGLKITPGRVAVINVLKELSRPSDVQEVVFELVKQNYKIDQATVYRILETLSQKEIVEKIDFREGKYRYELQEHHHHHLMCQKCGSITELNEECLKIDEAQILKEKKFLITGHSLEFFGLCARCQN